MKKLLLFILLVIFSLLGATYFTGSRIEKEYRQNLSQVAKRYGWEYEIVQYDRGWFSADVVAQLRKQRNTKLNVPSFTIRLEDRVSHGPLPFAYWVNTAMVSPGGGLIQRKATVSFGGKAVNTPPQKLSGLIKFGFTGNTVARYDIDSFVMREFFTASKVQLEVSSDGDTTDYDFRAASVLSPDWAGVSLLDVHHQITTDWQEDGRLQLGAILNAKSIRFDHLGYQVERQLDVPARVAATFNDRRRVSSLTVTTPQMRFKSGTDVYDLGEASVDYRHKAGLGVANLSLLISELASRRGDEAQANNISLLGRVTGLGSSAVDADIQLGVAKAWRKKAGKQVIDLRGLKLTNRWRVDADAALQLYRLLKRSVLLADDYEHIIEGTKKASLTVELDALNYQRKTRTIAVKNKQVGLSYRRATTEHGKQRVIAAHVLIDKLAAAEQRFGLKLGLDQLKVRTTGTVDNDYFVTIRNRLKALVAKGDLYDVPLALKVATQQRDIDIAVARAEFANWHVNYQAEQVDCRLSTQFIPAYGQGESHCRARRLLRDTHLKDHRDYSAQDARLYWRGWPQGEQFAIRASAQAADFKVGDHAFGRVFLRGDIGRLGLNDYQHASGIWNEKLLPSPDKAKSQQGMHESLIVATRPKTTIRLDIASERGDQGLSLVADAVINGKSAQPEAPSMAAEGRWLELLHFTSAKGRLTGDEVSLQAVLPMLFSPEALTLDDLKANKWLLPSNAGLSGEFELKQVENKMQLLVNGANRLQATPVDASAP